MIDQPRRGRLWFNDCWCVRLRPRREQHVWAYDFSEARRPIESRSATKSSHQRGLSPCGRLATAHIVQEPRGERRIACSRQVAQRFAAMIVDPLPRYCDFDTDARLRALPTIRAAACKFARVGALPQRSTSCTAAARLVKAKSSACAAAELYAGNTNTVISRSRRRIDPRAHDKGSIWGVTRTRDAGRGS